MMEKMTSGARPLLIVASVLFLTNAFSFAGLESETAAMKNLVKAQELMASHKWRRAVHHIERSLEDEDELSESNRNALVMLLAGSLRNMGKTKEAVDKLRSMVSGRPRGYYIELGECYLNLKRHDEALTASRSVLDEKGRLRHYQGIFLAARAYFGLKKYKKTMEECQRVMSGRIKGGHSLSDTEIDGRDSVAFSELRKRANALYEEARKLFEIQEYGEDYHHYRLAREAQFKGDFGEAIEEYAKIRGGALGMAALCHTGHCHAERGEIRDAKSCYERLIEEDSDLYQGEALYHAAVLEYLHGRRSRKEKAALAYVERLDNWLEKIKLFDKTIELDGINEKIKTDIISTAPRELLRPDDCGNLIRTKRYPGSIENRLTSPWYLPRLAFQTQLLRGYLLGESGEEEKAAEVYRKAVFGEHRIRMIKKRHETLGLLLTGLANGIYLFPGEAARKISSRHRPSLNWAGFRYSVEDCEGAEELFDAQLKNSSSSKGYERGAALLGKSYCLISQRKVQAAEEYLRRLRNHSIYKNLDIGRIAAYLGACHRMGNGKERKKARSTLGKLGESRHSLAPQALLALTTSLVNSGDYERAIDTCDKLRRKHSATPYADAAKTLRKALKIEVREEKRRDKDSEDGNVISLPLIKEKTGEVIHHQRTIVTPGGGDWHVDESTLGPGDWVLYKLKLIPRNECSIIRSVKVTLEPEEPQIEEAEGSTIEFVRAPLLFVSSLRHELREKFPEIYDKIEEGVE